VPAEEVERERAVFRRALRLPAAAAGEAIVRGVERRRARVLVGVDARAASVVERVAPVSYWKVLASQMGR
jgi:hypothetical protein